MKKYTICLLFLPSLLFSNVIKDYQKEYPYLNNFKVESKIEFKIKQNHEYTFKIILRKNTQYCFIGQGKNDFHFQIIEPSGNGWEGIFSRCGKIISLENIMDGGVYTIKIHSFSDNYIKIYWGEY